MTSSALHTIGTSVTSSTGDTYVGSFAVIASAIVITVVVAVVLVRSAQLRRIVLEGSAALQSLHALNGTSRAQVAALGTISQTFRIRVESKAKFDRFDLGRFMSSGLLEHEQWFEAEIGSRLRAVEQYGIYAGLYRRIEEEQLGVSGHPRLNPERFRTIERKLFSKNQLRRPIPKAHLVAEVSYTSPQGRNSYSRRLEWNFDQLRDQLGSAQAVRARQSTAQAMRARERSLMTHSIRMDILRRDGYRCRMCGATAADGATLHIDHILPVSRGGRTVKENLQTLCEPCNLGKSNRFVG